MKKKPFILSIFILVFGYSHAFSQTCLTDSLFSSTDPGAKVSHGVIMNSAKWAPGQTIRVKFLDRNSNFEAKVRYHVREWERYANIRFVFVDSGVAEIRISFRLQRDAYWSLVGKESRNYSLTSDGHNGIKIYSGNDGVSMNLGWPESLRDENEIKFTTLHEFGHALGLLHEHQNMNRPFRWNVDAVMAKYRRYGWSRESIEENVLSYYGEGTRYTNKAYDPHSVMHYPIEASLTYGFAVGYNTNLSSGDKAIIREMYPPAVGVNFSFNDIAVEHNVYEGNKKGMKIIIDFTTITSQYKQQHRMVAYFYFADGKPLKDYNQRFRTKTGNVSVGKDFTPIYERARFKTFTLFIPYSELHMNCGNYRMKFSFNVWKGEALAATSGYSYFTYKRPCPESTSRAGDKVIKHGPVELSTSVYRTSDRMHSLKFRAAVVKTNNKDELAKRVTEIMRQAGSHVWDNNWYYYRLAAGSNLLLAWKDLDDNSRGWVLVQRHNGSWWFRTNTGQWQKLSEDAEEPYWLVRGGKIVIGIKRPHLEGRWTVNDIMYKFAY